MKKLLSLPPNLVNSFHEITGLNKDEWFCTNDPIGVKLGSGGGTTWLLQAAYSDEKTGSPHEVSFDDWLSKERRLLLHAGGQSRRLPSYGPSGKILTPIPVFRWERGQRLSQDLLSLQIPLYQRIMNVAPSRLHTMIVSGDVYIRCTQRLQTIPDADVVCYGLWLGPEIAKDHGVFVMSRHTPTILECMLQKPSVETLNDLQKNNLYLTDIGIWLLSDRAVKLLMKHSMRNGEVVNYDLYGEFGCCLGTNPTIEDEELADLKVAILPLAGGEFYHYGTTREIISSTLAIQNLVNDQREIMHLSRKPHPSMFVQNAQTRIKLTEKNTEVWIENSCVSEQWSLQNKHVITGVPENDWQIELRKGQCVDIVPIGDRQWAVRPYGFNDKFRGQLCDNQTEFIGQPFVDWAKQRHLPGFDADTTDIQSAPIFPVVDNVNDMGLVLRWMLNEPSLQGGRMIWEDSLKLSADELSEKANLRRLICQRHENRMKNWPFLASNYAHSVFYQVDLDEAAHDFAKGHIVEPHPLPESEPLLTRIHDAMFRSELERLKGKPSNKNAEKAFSLLQEGLIEQVLEQKQNPRMTVFSDQIVWGRSPVRIDIAGGWTDTPPFCLMEGGNVVNLAIELNGQSPIQAYAKPCKENGYSSESYSSLREQLEAFGCGIEVTMFSAVPAGSGLGTSSILASTVLGVLNDFCGLQWDKNEISRRTLSLEQLLTTGGGWQDQFGGILHGVKLLQTTRGFDQNPVVRWLPTGIFTQPEYQSCHLLYYTGITRTAKQILAEIVRKMFLNQHEELLMLREMKMLALEMADAIQCQDYERTGRLLRQNWLQNQALDSGTNPAEVRRLTDLVDDLCLGYKLPGAGGGGFLYMMAKDVEAAARIKQIILANQKNPNARFVRMSLSENGLQVSRS